MAMSKKDYEAIAAVLKREATRPSGSFSAQQEVVQSVAEGLASVFANDNPRFDRERFLEAAGVQ